MGGRVGPGDVAFRRRYCSISDGIEPGDASPIVGSRTTVERIAQTRGDIRRRRGGLQPARRRRRRPHSRAAAGVAQRPHRPDDRGASGPRGQAHRRRGPGRVPQRGRRRALRHRSAELDGRAQRRRAGGSAHRLSHRDSHWRRRRGKRRRSHGRWRQHRRAPRRSGQAGSDMSFRGRLSTSQVAPRSEGERSRPDAAQKHCRAGAHLFAGGRRASRTQARPPAARGGGEARRDGTARGRRAACRGGRRPSRPRRSRRLVHAR
jgi:hypothetical protein